MSMISKCENIAIRINELENKLKNISNCNKPKRNYKKLRKTGSWQKLSKNSSTSSSTSLQNYRLNAETIKNVKTSVQVWRGKDKENKIEKNNKNFDVEMNRKYQYPSGNIQNKQETVMMGKMITSEDYWNGNLKTQEEVMPAEKESNACYKPSNKLTSGSIPLISIKEPPTSDVKQFCECMKKNPYNINYNCMPNLKEKFTTVNMLNMGSGYSRRINSGMPFVDPSAVVVDSEEKKVQFIDNSIIDGLRGEIEKVRYKLYEIGKRPINYEDSTCQVSREKTNVCEASSGDCSNNNSLSLVENFKELQKKNEELTQKLEEHKRLHESSMKKAEDATQLLNSYEKKVNTLHEQALKSSKMMAQSKEKFCNILRSRNCQIKSLYEINLQLKHTIVANTEQMKQLKNNYKILKTHYKELELKEMETKSDNLKLKENMKKLEKEFKSVYKDCEKLREENEKVIKKMNELEEDVSKDYNHKLTKHEEYLEELLRKSRDSETRLIEEVLGMTEQLQHHESELKEMKYDVSAETVELRRKYQNLLRQYENLVKKFHDYEQFDEIKCNCIEQELKEFSTKMKEKEGIILRERDELRKMVDDLNWAITQNKIILDDLNRENNEQEKTITNLKKNMKSKDAEILNYQKELKENRQQCQNLEKEIERLRKNLEENKSLGYPEENHFLKEFETLKEILSKEKDNNLIKQKIIADNELTIRDLKEQINNKNKELDNAIENLHIVSREMHRISDHIKNVENDLDKEREDKAQLLKELEYMNEHKETLENKVCELEETVKQQSKKDDLNKLDQKKLLEKIEQYMRRQKEEWEMQRRILQKDKEKALHAAKFASQKLLDSVNDFQKQMCQQKAAQAKLAFLLQGKEQQLENLTSKVKSLLPQQTRKCVNNPSSTVDNCAQKQNFCSSFCQLKQIYPDAGHVVYQSGESLNERESKLSSCRGSCSVYEYSDT